MHKITLCCLVFCLLLPIFSIAETITVSPNGKVKSLKEAIGLASAGDKIVVQKGLYKENEIVVDKPLTITGENYPTIDGGEVGQLITVKADDVSISGLHLRNTGISSLSEPSAIMLLNAHRATIFDNKIEDCFFGIYLSRARNSTIRDNHITSTGKVSELNRGNGIHMWECAHILVEKNYIEGQRDGIYLEFTTESEMRGNLSVRNLRYGLHFMFSHNDIYRDNIFRNNGAGVAVMYTREIQMIGNTFEQNWGSGAYGLLLKDISKSTIRNNTFYKNTTGLYMEGSSRLDITANHFNKNGWGVKLLANCSEDTFQLNNFTGNTFDISTNGYTTLNYLRNNYWDKYKGYDLNKDQTGDIPYRPVSLYSVIVEKVPYAIMFLRSFIVDLMDQMERVIPSFTPEGLQDEYPAMTYFKDAGAGKNTDLKEPASIENNAVTMQKAPVSWLIKLQVWVRSLV